MNPPNFFAELKRCNVYKVAVAYAVVGWLLVQITTQDPLLNSLPGDPRFEALVQKVIGEKK